MPFITTTDNTSLYYNDWGVGTPVILISGWPLTSASWEYQARFLAESGYRVISYDRRGFGKSDWAFNGYDYNTLAQDLESLINHLDLENTTLVGFSMGGGEVARYVSSFNHQNRVNKTVFIGAVTPFLMKSETNPDGIDKELFDDLVNQLIKDRPAFLKDLAKKFFSRSLMNHSVSDEVLEFFNYMALSASPKATIDLVRAWSETDFRNDLQSFSLPTLVIHGGNDLLVPAAVSGRLMNQYIEHALYHELENEPHGLCFTAGDRINQELLNFIK